ncbi:MAG: YdbL family protein [Desulfobacteraceae bacterium]|nr:YdbL family protein [Desulfobacteraceae bacterium]
MNMHKSLKIYILIVVCVLFSFQIASAGIKERMKERLPAIAGLKAKGVIGENNKGYLGFVSGVKEQEGLIAAENKDRNAIYNYIAKQQKTTVNVVEVNQAKRKAAKAKPGEFFQNPDGAWQKK